MALQKMEELSESGGTKAMVLAGDFNMPPSHPAYEFITSGKYTAQLKDAVKKYTHWDELNKVSPQRLAGIVTHLINAQTHNVLRLVVFQV